MMKKDKKWLKAEIDNQAIIMDKGYIHRGDLMYLINKLDEPEVLSQEWIRNNQERKGVHFFVNVTKLQNLLVPKQELPLLPKYVHEWITNYRDKYDLYPGLRMLENNTFVWGQIYEWYRMNTQKFVNAYLTGEYEVEEHRYYVLFGSQLHDDNWTYALTKSGSIELFEKDVLPEWDRTKLTEQEIKDYDPRYWAFAEPVEEDE